MGWTRWGAAVLALACVSACGSGATVESTPAVPLIPVPTAAPSSPVATMQVSSKPPTPATLPPAVIDAGGLTPAMAAKVSELTKVAETVGLSTTPLVGYRPQGEQAKIFAEAVLRGGSEAEARKRALPPWESAHVRGEAIDVPVEIAWWVFQNQEEFGLCRVYATQPTHFQLRSGKTCPKPAPVGGEDG